MSTIKVVIFIFLISISQALYAQYQLVSPNGNISVNISAESKIVYSVSYNNKPVIDPSNIGFTFMQAPPLGSEMKVVSAKTNSVDETWKPVLKRYSEISNKYNALVLELQEKKFPSRYLNIEFRAFDDGVAFHYEFPGQFNNRPFVLMDENVQFNFHDDCVSWGADHVNYHSSQEHEYFKRNLSDLSEEMVFGLPMTIKASNCYLAITEANLNNWAGMYLKADKSAGNKNLKLQLAPLPGQDEKGRKVEVSTPHYSPWRVMIIAETPGKLVESEMVTNLADPCVVDDVSWIKPGISAWDHWWSGEVKMDNETIRKYIDLASEMGWPYQLIDWQWYGAYNQKDADITTVAEQLDMPAILAYAKSKNVRCLVWLHSNDVHIEQFDKACALYESWGIAGVKIDFMDRDDQKMVNWYRKVVEIAAAHHLMVDFHGAYKPTGLRRTLPNLVTREGVMGNEYNKWSLRVTPEHNVTLPFTRMLAGPMDYTPGGFLNRTPDQFKNGTPANVLGTRSNTLAQFVIYDSPLTVACDHPDNYKGQIGVDFLKEVKTVWDDTRVLNGEIGEYITMARKSGKEWFIGSMTNSESRELEIELSFLEPGRTYLMTVFEDAEDANVNAEKAIQKSYKVRKDDLVKIKMVAGGGFAAFLK